MMYLLRTTACAIAVISASSTFAKPADYHAEAQSKLALPTQAAVVDTQAQTVDLEAIASSDPALSIRKGEGDEPDAMVMLSDVLFDFAEADLAPEALQTLEGIAQKLEGVRGIQITGHTDSIGSLESNEQLGLERAEAVAGWLVDSGYLPQGAITVFSAGETQPIAANSTTNGQDDETGRALNRRVEFSIVEEQKVTASLEAWHPTVY